MKYEVFTNSDKSFKPMSKKLLFSFFLTLSVSLSVVGQITLYNEYVGYNDGGMNVISTTNLGTKVVFLGSSTGLFTDSVRIYNQDGTLYKEFKLPSGFDYVEFSSYNNSLGIVKKIHSFSDNLFNLDNKIEFLCFNSNTNTISVFNEDLQQLFTFPDFGQNDFWLYKFGNDFKIGFFRVLQPSSIQSLKLYSLPGTLPCDQCSGISGLEEPNTGGDLGEMKVFPNPFNNTLQVNYDFPTNQSNPRLILTDILGRELREIKLTSQTDNVSINTTDLPKGTIIVLLYGGQNMISKKVIKID